MLRPTLFVPVLALIVAVGALHGDLECQERWRDGTGGAALASGADRFVQSRPGHDLSYGSLAPGAGPARRRRARVDDGRHVLG